jgi:ribonucleoside-diphosphate reductase alpha chain
VFRELAISYLGRHDLAHIDPSEIGHDVMGSGVSQDKAPETPTPAPQGIGSRGFVRGRTTNFIAIDGGMRNTPPATTLLAVQGATALKAEEAPEQSAPDVMSLGFSAPATSSPTALRSSADKRAEALMKGYVGDSCGECGNFTLVRNGTCLKCDTCGGTTGCS